MRGGVNGNSSLRSHGRIHEHTDSHQRSRHSNGFSRQHTHRDSLPHCHAYSDPSTSNASSEYTTACCNAYNCSRHGRSHADCDGNATTPSIPNAHGYIRATTQR